MASDNGGWPPKNLDMIGAGDKQSVQEIVDGGSQTKPEGKSYTEHLFERDGITAPNEPVSEKTEPEKEPQQLELSIQKDEPIQTEFSFQKNETEKEEPEKD